MIKLKKLISKYCKHCRNTGLFHFINVGYNSYTPSKIKLKGGGGLKYQSLITILTGINMLTLLLLS